MTATERGPLCVSIVLLGSAYTASDLLINVIVLCLPFSLISGLLGHLATKQKYAVGGMFALGVLVYVTSLAHMILFLQSPQGTDITFDSGPLAAWPLIEANLGIVVACLPNLRPMFVRSTLSSAVIGYTISSPIASSKVIPQLSGWANLIPQNVTDTKDPFDDNKALVLSKSPRVSLKELETDMEFDNTRCKMHERNDTTLTYASAESGRSADRAFGPPLMTEIKCKAVPQSNDSTPQDKELLRLPWTWNGTVDDDDRNVGEERIRESSMV